jgi:hypothetical protein
VGGAFAPQIFKQPASFAGTIGGTATFTVGAQGTDPISYQWRKNGSNIAGATNNSITLENVSFETGDYDVLVTNPAGTTTSSKATLSINFADVHTYSGITLRGAVGDKFLIESQDQLDPASSWQTVTNITLSASRYIWIDYDSPDQGKRFFRATYLGR